MTTGVIKGRFVKGNQYSFIQLLRYYTEMHNAFMFAKSFFFAAFYLHDNLGAYESWPPWVKKLIPWYQKAVHPFRFNNFEHLILGSGGTKIKDLTVAPSGWDFMTHLYFPESAVPNNGKVGNRVLCPHSRCFGSYFDVIVLMYIVSSSFSFKPTSSSSIIFSDPVSQE